MTLLSEESLQRICEEEGVSSIDAIDHADFFERRFTHIGKGRYRMDELASSVCKQIDISLKQAFQLGIQNNIGSTRKSVVAKIWSHRRRDARKNCYFPRFYYLPDLKKAFMNTSYDKCHEILESRFSTDFYMSTLLKLFCFQPKGGLIIGSSAASFLFHLHAVRLIDGKLRRICRKTRITCTRYVDDFVFSSNHEFDLENRQEILSILRDAGYEINFQKTKVCNLSKGSVHINGVSINKVGKKGTLTIPKKRRNT